MIYGKTNIVAGFLFMFIAACGGFALGGTFEATYAGRGGDHIMTMARFYLREGHSHGMPIAMFNIIVGLVLDRLALSDRTKRRASWAAVCGILLPLGLAAKGAAGAPANFPPLGLPGILGMFIAISVCLVGAIKMRRDV